MWTHVPSPEHDLRLHLALNKFEHLRHHRPRRVAVVVAPVPRGVFRIGGVAVLEAAAEGHVTFGVGTGGVHKVNMGVGEMNSFDSGSIGLTSDRVVELVGEIVGFQMLGLAVHHTLDKFLRTILLIDLRTFIKDT